MDERYADNELAAQLTLDDAKCALVASVLRLRAGGFELVFDREASDFEGLEVDQITKLRKLAREDGVCLVGVFPQEEHSREFERRIEAAVTHWLEQAIGFRVSSKAIATWDVLR